MVTLTLDKQYADVLQHFGDIQELSQALIHRYALEKIQQKIDTLQSDINSYEQKYGLSYPEFEQKDATDEAFIHHIETIDFLWERDSMIWMHSIAELKAWQTRLDSIKN